MSNLTNLILAGRFREARSLVVEGSLEELREPLVRVAYESDNICCYAFFAWLASSEPNAESHLLASDLLIGPFASAPGAYAAALHHVREAARLEPNDLGIQEQLLFFSTVPDRLVEPEEALAIAERILGRDPKSEAAGRILERFRADS